ncbi:uncharacterized protein FIBRA_07646 [Fibroporia radiculosa]|uniref:Uncharacterized protein n=1 Tax=Fibroporia radiculosa TaxID=599839 RepID=J4H4R1_9APHY|nr:uncharacterized protein FIBRA_07646 [Fibroporia radiculosa]CCM05429.1 predicted protein [Fibroporia radiculosa]
MKSFLSVFIFASFAVTMVSAADYAAYFYPNYDCSGEATLDCVGDIGQCCNAPSGPNSNSVYIEYVGSGSFGSLNWAISAVPGCSQIVQFDTQYTGSGPFGTGCYNAHDASVGSVAYYAPEP